MLNKTNNTKNSISNKYSKIIKGLENIFEKIKKELVKKKELSQDNLKVWEENNQHLVHGFAWIATYIEALRQINNWGIELANKNKLNEFEQLILDISFIEYIRQILNGIPMSQTEFIKITDYEIINKNEYSLFVKINDSEVDAFLHCNDLTYSNNGEEELAKYKKGDQIKVKVLEIKVSEQKVRVGLRQTQPDPFDWFSDKKVNQIITVKIISTDNKGLMVRPEGCDMDFQIKKSQIAINAADARPSRFTGGERIDCAISELDSVKRKVSLSIKLLEEIEKKEALEKYGVEENSGKNLPFSSLSEDLKKKEKKDK